jgi:coenzyme PQQ precursor peptide PqqA
MKWVKPTVLEHCVGMEVTSYDSAEIEPDTLL